MNNEAREWYRIISTYTASLAPNGWVEEDDPAIDIDPLLSEAMALHIYGTSRGGL